MFPNGDKTGSIQFRKVTDSRRASRKELSEGRYLDAASLQSITTEGHDAGSLDSSDRQPCNVADEARFKEGLAVDALVGTNAILVSNRQENNPVVKYIKNVRVQFSGDLVPDFVLGTATCAVYITVRYHVLHKDYLQLRLEALKRVYKTRVVLCYVDIDDNAEALKQINKTAIVNNFTLILAWSLLEAARYLETYKVYENKSATIIQQRMEVEHAPRLNDALTQIRSVNKTDVLTMTETFGSLRGIMNASIEELSLCPGIGEKKVARIYDTFHKPFKMWHIQGVTGGVEETKDR